jgi:hypothetical protein
MTDIYYFSFASDDTFLGGAYVEGATRGAALQALEAAGQLGPVAAAKEVEVVILGPVPEPGGSVLRARGCLLQLLQESALIEIDRALTAAYGDDDDPT